MHQHQHINWSSKRKNRYASGALLSWQLKQMLANLRLRGLIVCFTSAAIARLLYVTVYEKGLFSGLSRGVPMQQAAFDLWYSGITGVVVNKIEEIED